MYVYIHFFKTYFHVLSNLLIVSIDQGKSWWGRARNGRSTNEHFNIQLFEKDCELIDECWAFLPVAN